MRTQNLGFQIIKKLKKPGLLGSYFKKMQEIYPPFMHAQEGWMEIKEFYCPGCFTLLETKALLPGYPLIFDFVPDLKGFYKEILKCELP